MPWKYEQSTGKLFKPDGSLFYTGYAGKGSHLNQPGSQQVSHQGPIPRGLWMMTKIFDSHKTTRQAIVLEPQPGTNDFGRSDFQIHGGRGAGDYTASSGCIIVEGVARRQTIWYSGDHILEVVQ